jgi:hypothetical protein
MSTLLESFSQPNLIIPPISTPDLLSNMKSIAAILAVVAVLSCVAQADVRCGWWVNPSPGNVWLNDAHGSWTLGVQGGYQAKGNLYPTFSHGQFIPTSPTGDYGYGCACITGTFDPASKHVVTVTATKAQIPGQCSSLHKPMALNF